MKESHRGGTGSWCCFLEGFQKEAQAGAAMTASSLQTDRCSPVTPTGGVGGETQNEMNQANL